MVGLRIRSWHIFVIRIFDDVRLLINIWRYFHQNIARTDTLQILAKKHYQTKFIKVDVDNVPFLVVSLKVQVLPCILAFINGIGVDRYIPLIFADLSRIVGFDDLGNTDDFSTARLEYRLIETGIFLDRCC